MSVRENLIHWLHNPKRIPEAGFPRQEVTPYRALLSAVRSKVVRKTNKSDTEWEERRDAIETKIRDFEQAMIDELADLMDDEDLAAIADPYRSETNLNGIGRVTDHDPVIGNIVTVGGKSRIRDDEKMSRRKVKKYPT